MHKFGQSTNEAERKVQPLIKIIIITITPIKQKLAVRYLLQKQ